MIRFSKAEHDLVYTEKCMTKTYNIVIQLIDWANAKEPFLGIAEL
jgi:hypothetical protein